MNKGFTLIELLAVIVLLILLIGVGVFSVNKILKSSRKELSENQKRNLEKIAETYNIAEGIDKDAYCVSVADLLKKGYIEGTSVIDPKNKEQLTGSIRIKYINNKYTYTYQDKECTPCELVEGEPKEIGSKYECEVKKGTIYNFYVLSYNDEDNNTIYDKSNAVTINLIMDRNICEDGSLTNSTKSDKCLVAWNSSGYNSGGPVTAMEYLNNATSTWTNLENLNITYTDEGNHFTDFPITGKARLPRLTEIKGKCSTSYGSCPLYLVNYLKSSSYVTGEGLINIGEIYGYWTLSSNSVVNGSAWHVDYDGRVIDYYGIGYADSYGVRPVITVKL